MRPAVHEGRVAAFAIACARIFAKYPYSATSWWRDPAHNRAVKGLADSFHLEGLGLDLVPANARHRPGILIMARQLGLDAVDEGDHVHLELDYRRH